GRKTLPRPGHGFSAGADWAELTIRWAFGDMAAVNAETFPLAARGAGGSTVYIGDVPIGGPEVVLIAGPCSVESESQLRTTALTARAGGASILRGGAFKPRTSP